ncbi:hypothetical protein [Oxalicibacterium faecigallinarum]|uniref:Uncharacterized protein n=1 Tax=Oxalicibacterium faecigallinarum TaxID=573741 RepID=A0A8J3AV60_9BURK|nr:hypothetical protein [Oxalicibacterium faecigallinarum]GGI20480.1 hypothetical protein GCM10008066_24240 [Oxalicibacterium faecigallinarum]
MKINNLDRFSNPGVLTPSTPFLGSTVGAWERAFTKNFAERIRAEQEAARLNGYSYEAAVKLVKEQKIKSQDVASSIEWRKELVYL